MQPDYPEPDSHHERIAALFRTTILPRLSRLYRTSTLAADIWRDWAAVLRISDFGEEVTIYHCTSSANWHDISTAGSIRAERWPTEPSQWEGKPPLLTLISASAETTDDDDPPNSSKRKQPGHRQASTRSASTQPYTPGPSHRSEPTGQPAECRHRSSLSAFPPLN